MVGEVQSWVSSDYIDTYTQTLFRIKDSSLCDDTCHIRMVKDNMTFIRYLIFATYKVQELRTNTHSLIESSQIYHEMTNILLFYRKHKERSTWSCGFTVRKCKSGFALGFTLYTVSDYFSWLTLPKYSLKGVIFCFILYLVVSCLRLGFFLFM